MIVDEFIHRYYFDTISTLGYECFVEDAIPETLPYPFVVLREVQCIERFSPCPMWVSYVTIDIVTGSKNKIGRVPSLQIAEDIHTAIKSSVGYTDEGYRVNSTYTTNSTPLSESDSINNVYRNIRTYVHQVSIVS
jgi:hypothetical protein